MIIKERFSFFLSDAPGTEKPLQFFLVSNTLWVMLTASRCMAIWAAVGKNNKNLELRIVNSK